MRFDEPAKQLRYEHLLISLTNHRPDDATIGRIEELRADAKRLGERIIELSPYSREQSLALTHLEDCIMWAVKAMVLPR